LSISENVSNLKTILEHCILICMFHLEVFVPRQTVGPLRLWLEMGYMISV